MLVHLVATLALATVACLTLWSLARSFGRPLPRYLLPMMAGSVAIAYGVYAEYSWASRTVDGLPASFVVLQRGDERTALAPWTWLVPRTVRLATIDTAAVRRHPEHPELRLLDVVLLERFHPTVRVTTLVDCAGGRRADVGAGQAFDADGLPAGLGWREVGAEDDLVRAVCTTPTAGSAATGARFGRAGPP